MLKVGRFFNCENQKKEIEMEINTGDVLKVLLEADITEVGILTVQTVEKLDDKFACKRISGIRMCDSEEIAFVYIKGYPGLYDGWRVVTVDPMTSKSGFSPRGQIYDLEKIQKTG